MNRACTGFGLLSAIGLIVVFSPALASAQHLDRVETRRNIRYLCQRTDDFQDRLEGWIEEHGHREERMHQAIELNHQLDAFETSLLTLRLALIQHDEPWDARDQAKAMIDSARELHRAIEHAAYLPPEVTADWKQMHDLINTVATQFHLQPLQ
ncbi:MAG TPA: hypothetical protein VHY37_09210 [Tepidisphaeraceae bacterium]|jgi:hypothetical protein|nr:hypothetical protein [Tepidisphaeraceae bacterium]